MKRFFFALLCGAVALTVMQANSALASIGTFALYNPPADNTIVNEGPLSNPIVVKGVSSPSGYAGMKWQAPSGFTFADLVTLSADYQMLNGSTFHGGSPRFTLFDDSFNSAYVYWGNTSGGGSFTDPNAGTYGNTGNYIGSTDARFESNGFGGLNTQNTYSSFAAAPIPGATIISFITLDLDGGFAGQQTMLFDKFTVNTDIYDAQAGGVVPEPGTVFVWSVLLIAGGSVLYFRRNKFSSRVHETA